MTPSKASPKRPQPCCFAADKYWILTFRKNGQRGYHKFTDRKAVNKMYFSMAEDPDYTEAMLEEVITATKLCHQFKKAKQEA